MTRAIGIQIAPCEIAAAIGAGDPPFGSARRPAQNHGDATPKPFEQTR